MKLNLNDFLAQSHNRLLIDVRSEAEFAQGHIPGAVNMPLFSNEERAKVGTLYKQVGQREAMLLGLDIVGPKMSAMVKQVEGLTQDKEIFVHCWRGGMRSQSVAWLLSLFGYQAHTLQGGYKGFRSWVLSYLGQPFPLRVLGGLTGSGKTFVLNELSNLGAQVIDLEALANHKGSAFGALGMGGQPSNEHFENSLATQLSHMDLSKCIWIEDESRGIGTVYIPNLFFLQLQQAPMCFMEVPFSRRVTALVQEYGKHPKEALGMALSQVKKRMGGLIYQQAMSALEEGNLTQVAEIALAYYDKSYFYALTRRGEDLPKGKISFTDESYQQIAAQLIHSFPPQ